MATSNGSPDPASQLLSLNRNQTVNATVEATGQPDIANNIGMEGNTGAGVIPGSTQGIGPASLSAAGPYGSTPSGAVSNTQNVSAGAPSGAGQPAATAGFTAGGAGSFSGAAGQNSYIVSPGGATTATPGPGGGANGPTPSNAWEVINRTS